MLYKYLDRVSASMRPRRKSLGKPRCCPPSRRSGHGFNEAQAEKPGKTNTPASAGLSAVWASMRPRRKSLGKQLCQWKQSNHSIPSFNEAQAEKPGKTIPLVIMLSFLLMQLQ